VSEDQVRPLFERVLTAPPPDTTDVDAAIRSGRSRHRVRTATAVLSSAAVVAGLLTAATVIVDGDPAPDRAASVTGPPPAPRNHYVLPPDRVVLNTPGVDVATPVTAVRQLAGRWRAVRLEGRDVWAARDDGDPVTVSFEVREDGRVFGGASDGCNHHYGEVTVSGSGRFEVPGLGSTAVLCGATPYAANVDALLYSDQARIVPAAGAVPTTLLLQRRGRVVATYERVAAGRTGYTPRTLLSSVRAAAGPVVAVTGRLRVGAHGCVALDGRTAVFPAGTTWGARLNRVVLPDGTLAGVGDVVRGVGAVVPSEAAQRTVSGSTERRSCAWTSEAVVFAPGSNIAVGP
jgi:heat shock protein HslJ